MALTSRFDDALLLASDLHREQCRKGCEVPYVAHLLGVTSLVLEYGGDEDEAIAALLHDAVEDAGGPPTLRRIREQFGDRVAEIVDHCTDADCIPKPPWQARKEAYIAKLPSGNKSSWLVSGCDKLHNTRSIVSDLRVHGDRTWQKFTGRRDGSLWYYTTLLAEFRKLDVPTDLLAELDRTVTEMQRLAQ
ncbi:MAG: HD domain-containing protein [Planctomycetaceae bacterium]|nr:HD domain-containing protein [Planctomycetaceae bacterium]